MVAVVCGVMGCFVILRRMAFLGDALSHAMLAGVTAGYLFMQIFFGIEAHAPAMLVGSILAGLVTVGLVGFVSKVSRIKDDTAIGIMYTGIFALGGILASVFSHRIHLDLYHFVTGMVLGVEDGDLWMMAWIAAFVLTIVILFYRHLQITTFDPVMAASLGFPVMAINYLLTTCTSLVVVGAVNIVGVILVVGLLVTPAATAYLLSDRLSRMLPLAAGFGVIGVLGGLYLSMWIGNVATGPVDHPGHHTAVPGGLGRRAAVRADRQLVASPHDGPATDHRRHPGVLSIRRSEYGFPFRPTAIWSPLARHNCGELSAHCRDRDLIEGFWHGTASDFDRPQTGGTAAPSASAVGNLPRIRLARPPTSCTSELMNWNTFTTPARSITWMTSWDILCRIPTAPSFPKTSDCGVLMRSFEPACCGKAEPRR